MSISSMSADIEEVLFSTKKRMAGTLAGIILLLSIPVTLTLIQQQQDIRQQASSVQSAAIAQCTPDGGYCGTAGAPLGGCCSGTCDCSVDNNNCTCKPAGGPTCGGNACASGEVCCPGFYICGNPSSCGGCSVFQTSVCGCVDDNSKCSSGQVCSSGTCTVATYQVGGTVYVDANKNGIRDCVSNCSGQTPVLETGYQGATLRIQSGGQTTTSQANGFYSFFKPAGSYSITLTAPSGYAATSANPLSFTLSAPSGNTDPNLAHNFGIAIAPPTPTPTRTPTPTPTSTPVPTTTPTSTPKPKLVCDPNDDGVVDFLDFQWWKDEFTEVRPTSLADCNNDEVIDLLDFQIWKNIAIFKLSPTP